MKRTRLHLYFALAIVIGVSLLYGNTILNGYIHDDHGQVETNTHLKSLMNLPKVVTSCIWESAVGNCKQTYYYRPLQTLSYMITYQFSAQPWIFHMVNLLYFAADVFLIFYLIKELTKNTTVAAVAAILFLVHPLNTEVVNWVATVPELLYVLFVLLSVMFFIKLRKTNKQKYLWWTIATYGLAIMSKEPAVFTPFVFLFLDLVVYKKRITWKNSFPYVACVVLFALYMAARFSVLGGLGADPTYKITLPQRVYTFIELFGQYTKKLFWPMPLNLFYPYHRVYALNVSFATDVLLFVGYVVSLVWAIKKRWAIVGFTLVWYITYLAPSLIFINSIGENLFAERHVFASTIGFVLLVSLGLSKLAKYWRWGIVLALAIPSVFVVVTRNIQWRSDETIYFDTLKKSPDADLIRYNLGLMYRDSGRLKQAREELNKVAARKQWDGMYKVFNNLGDLSRREGNNEEAERYFRMSLTSNPYHVNAMNNLAALYVSRGDFVSAIQYLCHANEIDPTFQIGNSNLDQLIKQINAMSDKDFLVLQSQMTTAFRKADSAGAALLGKDCSFPEGCLFTFGSFNPRTYFLPYLFSTQVGNATLRPLTVLFAPQQGTLSIGMDHKYEKSALSFTAPACNGTYYTLITPAN